MWTFFGIGYRTRSDSSAYWKRTLYVGVAFETTSNGIPIGPPSHVPEPKSACTGESSPIEAISCAESEATGSVSTRSFHALLAGKTGQCRAAGRRRAWADDPLRSTAVTTAARARRVTSPSHRPPRDRY